MTQEVRIPDIGDIDEVEVIEICVAVGDQVGPDDALIVIESDKASMEVPAGVAGTIASIDVALGDQVAEGALVVTLTADEAASDSPEPAPMSEAPAAETAPESTPPASTPEPAAASAAEATAGLALVEVRVPDIGEATDVVVIEVAAAAGDVVSESDLLVVVESDKASMEIPAGQAGTVTAMHVQEGSEVAEGTLIATIETAAAASPGEDSGSAVPEPEVPIAAPAVSERAEPATRAGEKNTAPETDEETGSGAGSRVYASPAVRRLARELGVTLGEVKGTGAKGRILKDDVKAHVKSAMTSASSPAAAASSGAGIPPIPAVDFSRFGPVEISPMSRVRIAGATNLHRSWLNLPHVTQFEEADVTELEAFRKTLKEEAARRDVKITPLAFIIKACCYALQAFPTFNASLDPEIKNFVLKKYYHIGFAVDTPDGLVVPVIRDADRMGVWDLSDLAEAIADLAEKARVGKLGMSDLQGGSFSISSLGNIGGTGFTPIINLRHGDEVAGDPMGSVFQAGARFCWTKPIWDGSEFLRVAQADAAAVTCVLRSRSERSTAFTAVSMTTPRAASW